MKDETKCLLCNGTGYTGPGGDYIGCCICGACKGTGESESLLNIDGDKAMEKAKNATEVLGAILWP